MLIRSPATVLPVAFSESLTARIGKPGPCSDVWVTKWPLAMVPPAPSTTVKVPVLVDVVWNVSRCSLKTPWNCALKVMSSDDAPGAEGHSATKGTLIDTSLSIDRSWVGGAAPAGKAAPP